MSAKVYFMKTVRDCKYASILSSQVADETLTDYSFLSMVSLY